MIKFLLGVIVALALIGGAIKFQSDEESWQLIIHKQEALYSVKNGAIRIYNIVEELISGSDAIETSTLVVED
ncbi:MAG: hypothetical protein QF447_05325 [Candidatus Thioglobus sp.]|jgi:hypothetical protein|nr:hypothetical protein [Candidatus Thioglobus sp.]|tara:strand:- start:475 stop:690 length:216 start_codon:yes stop_codon:yes gene_type:complete